MMQIYYRILDAVAPPLSIRRQFLFLCRQIPRVLLRHGPGDVLRRTGKAFLRYFNTGALVVPIKDLDQAAGEAQWEPISYAEWIAATEPRDDALALQRILSHELAYRPLISFIVPIFNPPGSILETTIASVLAQTYPHWQLCLADGGSTDPHISAVLDSHRGDERIATTRLDRNLGISGNSNAALSLADGEYVVLLDHDDVLSPDMLFEVVSLLNRYPDTDIVYYDEDLISADREVREPFWFKPEFSPDLILSANMLMHGVFRRSLVLDVGCFDSSTDGAQDWDLALRCSRRTASIRHIPKVLYHWRKAPGSSAMDPNAKAWATDAQAIALKRHIEATDGVLPSVEIPYLGSTRIIWPHTDVRVSIIIPTKDKRDVLHACVDSILTTTAYTNYEIILVDTGSVLEETQAYYDNLLAQHSNIKLLHQSGPFNYSRANNSGAAAATGELLLFLNNDTKVIEPDWLHELAGWALRPGVGVVGAKLLLSNGEIQHAGVVIGHSGPASHIFRHAPDHTFGIFGSTDWYRTYAAVTGACMMVPAHIFRAIGGFDEVYRLVFSDVEFCLRVGEAGFRTVYTPYAHLIHNEGSSRGFHLPPSDVLRGICQMLPAIRQGDGHFNSNLSLRQALPALARLDEPTSFQSLFEVMGAYGLLPQRPPDVETPSIEMVDLAQPVPWPDAKSTPYNRKLDDLTALLVVDDLSWIGTSVHATILAQAFTAMGIRTSVISPEDGPLRDAFAIAGVSVEIASSSQYPQQKGGILTRIDTGALTRAMHSNDLVVVNGIAASLATIVAAAFGKPNILCLAERDSHACLSTQSAIVRDALSHADHIVLWGHRLADLYDDLIPQERISVIPLGLAEQAIAAGKVDVHDSLRAVIMKVANVGQHSEAIHANQ